MNGISNLGTTLASDVGHTLDVVKAETLENKTSSLYKTSNGTVQFKEGSFYMARFANATKADAGLSEAKALLTSLVDRSGLPQSHMDRLKTEISDTFSAQMGTRKTLDLQDLSAIKQSLVAAIAQDYAPDTQVSVSVASSQSSVPSPQIVTIGADDTGPMVPASDTLNDAAIAAEVQAHENDIADYLQGVTQGANDTAIAEELQAHETDIHAFKGKMTQSANDAEIAEQLQAHEADIQALKDKAVQQMNDAAIAKALSHEDG